MFVISKLNRRRLSQDSRAKEFQFNFFSFVVFMPLHHNNFFERERSISRRLNERLMGAIKAFGEP